MLNLQVGNTPDKTALTVSGDLTIENAEEFRNILLKIHEGTDTLSLDLSQTGAIDVSGLQLLCSAHKSWCAAGKNVVLTPGTLEALSSAVEEAGYVRSSGCTPLTDCTCLFTGGSHG